MADACAECGFAWDIPVAESLRVIEQLPQAVRDTIATGGHLLFERPSPQVWSPNEYIWHLADIFRLGAEWLHDICVLDHPTHYAVDMDALADVRGYSRLSLQTGLWSLEQLCSLFIAQAAVTPPERTCYYHDWQDVTAAQVVAFLTHEAVHHLFDLRRILASREASHVR
jgi:hypothetical protein